MARAAKPKADCSAGLALLERIGSRRVVPSRRAWIEKFVQCPQKKETEVIGPLRLNIPQQILDDARQKAEGEGRAFRAAILKARQWGITLLATAWQLEEAIRTPNTQGCIVAPDDSLARDVLHRLRSMTRLLPFELPTKYENRAQLYFDAPIHSSIDVASAHTKDPGRGHTYRFVHATEPGTWKDPESKVASLNQSVPNYPGTVLCYEGTARGIGNWWHNFWWDAREGRNDYTALFFPWWADPEFDYFIPLTDEQERALLARLDDEEKWLLVNGATPGGIAWRRYHIRNNFSGYPELFRQEFPATPEEAFLSSGNPAFTAKHVISQRDRKRPMVWRGEIELGAWKDGSPSYRLMASPKGSLKVWKEPERDTQYLIGADTGHGMKDGDFSVGCVIDRDTSEQVAELTCRFDPHVFADLLYCLGMHYNRAYMLPEANAVGQATISFLIDRGYPNLGRRPTFDATTHTLQPKWGWQNTPAQKEVLVQTARGVLAEAWEQAQDAPVHGIVHSDELLTELFEYAVDYDPETGKASYSAPGRHHDDHVSAWMIALIARRDVLQLDAQMDEKPHRMTTHEWLWHDVREALDPEYVPKEEDTWEAIA